MQQTQQLRPFTETEKGIALTTSAAVHYLIRMLDQLQHTNMFRRKLKQTGNSFLAELEKHAKQTVWDVSVEGSDIGAAAEQMEGITDLFHNLLVLAMACGEIPAGQRELFWLEIAKNFKRFDIPLRISHDGDLQFVERTVPAQ
ncbi:hypothetical protein [Dyadobacter bucti]|uniref:hypothetical protein n=1 Tax=Dyadobacter bucti TaxID=2572203 RepID=UPI00110936D4|nr:hypothetical protein [Dyadobacter bucti]